MEVMYELTDFNPIGVSERKTQIILTDTKRDVKNYIQSLRYRYNKKNPYLPHFVISKKGEIYKIMEPNMYSNYLENETYDKKSIIISLENFGCLKKNTLEDYISYLVLNVVLMRRLYVQNLNQKPSIFQYLLSYQSSQIPPRFYR